MLAGQAFLIRHPGFPSTNKQKRSSLSTLSDRAGTESICSCNWDVYLRTQGRSGPAHVTLAVFAAVTVLQVSLCLSPPVSVIGFNLQSSHSVLQGGLRSGQLSSP